MFKAIIWDSNKDSYTGIFLTVNQRFNYLERRTMLIGKQVGKDFLPELVDFLTKTEA